MLKTSYNFQIAQERMPADHNKASNSPHLGDTRQKSINKGITTISVSKKTSMHAKVREFRKPIFSPNGHQISSNSIKQMIPVVQLQITSSGTKRSEHSRQSNNINSKLQRRQSLPYVTHDSTFFSNQQTHYNNVLSIMRDQLQRSISTLQKQNQQEIRESQQRIIVLQKQLKQNQQVLKQRTYELEKFKENNSINTSSNKTIKRSKQQIVQQFNSNIQYLTGKLRDIQTKINIVLSNKIGEAKIPEIVKKLEQKIDRQALIWMEMELTKFNTLSARVTKFVESRDKLLLSLQSMIHQMESKQTKSGTSKSSLGEDKIFQLKSNQEKIIKSLEAYSLKQFKYDNFEVDTLRGELNRLTDVVSKLEKEIVSNTEKIDQQYQTNAPQKHPHLPVSTINLASFKQFQSPQFPMSSKFSFTVPTCSFQDYNPPQQGSQDQRDHFFYPDQDSSYQRFTDQQQDLIQQQSNEAIVQLAQTIRQRKLKMPVKCSMNQGYLKIVDIGAYILDLKGSLMQFTDKDVQTAIARKIIIL